MRVAVVAEPRSLQAGGLERAEQALFDAVRSYGHGIQLDVWVAGRRSARRYAKAIGGRWLPATAGRGASLASRGADLVHLTGPGLRPPRTKYVVSVHDLAPLRFPDEGVFPHEAAELMHGAVGVVTPSAFTAHEVASVFRVPIERIRVVPNGPCCRAQSAQPLNDEELAALGLAAPLVLRIGGYTQRKNVALLSEAWPAIREETSATLALVGPLSADRPHIASADLSGVRLLGYVDESLLARLLRTATVLVSTSTYEGFGLPPLEAMSAGLPVVAVRSPASIEVCGGSALLVEDRASDLAEAVVAVCKDRSLHERLRNAGASRAALFTWERAARELVGFYSELA